MKRIVGCKWILTSLLAGIAICQLPGAARSTTPSNHIYLQSGGGVVDACATSSYQGGQVNDLATGAVIGTVPPGSFTIYNANNQAIGYISPEV